LQAQLDYETEFLAGASGRLEQQARKLRLLTTPSSCTGGEILEQAVTQLLAEIADTINVCTRLHTSISELVRKAPEPREPLIRGLQRSYDP